ncbi:TPA: hypothetical protein SH124_002434 [Staphylococcus aureus]|nr:hypothetical protein [Staphylococcus aureus]
MQEFIVNTDKSCKNYSLLNNLYEIIFENIDDNQNNNITSKYPEEILEFLLKTPEFYSEIYNTKESVIELKAISLRLSRHHMKRANFIEQVARLVAEMMYMSDIKITIRHFEYADRPSIMVINRVIQILQIKYQLKKCLYIEMNDFSSHDELLLNFRNNLFKNLHKKNVFFKENVSIINKKKELLFEIDESYESLDAALLEQNYELAYLILKKEYTDKNMTKQMYYRWLGVISANLSISNEANNLLLKAVQNSENIIDKARNTYIYTLHLTKRLNKPEESIIIIKKMLEELEMNKDIEDIENYLHEKAWLKNGLSLAQTINSKNIHRDAVEIIKNEMDSYKSIAESNNFKFVYLKYNLLANIAFLLEILNEYKKAENFWEMAFGKLFLDENNNLDDVKPLSYRLGVLNIKMDNFNKAKYYLKKAEKLAYKHKNDFHVLNINYALSYIDYLEGNVDKDKIKQNIKLAVFLNDDFYKVSFEDILNGLDPRPPKLKLISYVPNIDLSFVPKVDMNEKLDTFNWRGKHG